MSTRWVVLILQSDAKDNEYYWLMLVLINFCLSMIRTCWLAKNSMNHKEIIHSGRLLNDESLFKLSSLIDFASKNEIY